MPPIDALLGTTDRSTLRQGLAGHATPLALPMVHKLTAHALGLAPEPVPCRLAVVHTYTSDLLDPWFRLAGAVEGLAMDVWHAPYGLALNEARADSDLVRHRPDVTLLMLQREDLHPGLASPLAGRDDADRRTLGDQALEHLLGVVRSFRAVVDGRVVVTLLPPLDGPGAGLFDAMSDRSEAAFWSGFKTRLATALRTDVAAATFLDLDDLVRDVGARHAFDRRFWYSARYPFTPLAAHEFARRVVAVAATALLPRAKVIALDADNTLWGGIVGEDGLHGIALGPDHPGNAFVAFQRRLLEFQQRGFLLVLCSKNNQADVDEVLNGHPHQVIRQEHLAAQRVNWLPKPDNLESLAAELNLGLESFVFVDDSDHECAAVRQRWPQVEVVQTPKRAIDVPTCLDPVARLEVLAITAEDRKKTAMYAAERQRRELEQGVRAGGGDPTEYLRSLEMHMTVAFDDPSALARQAQLTQKTNQFNLTTRRYQEGDVQGFHDAPDRLVAHFSLADVFGDSGIVGLALCRFDAPDRAHVDTFLMSCRVIGREAESAFLHAVLRELARRGATTVTAEYLPTKKNVLVERFLPEQGFEPESEPNTGEALRYSRDLATRPPRPADDFPITVDVAGSGSQHV